ncbi:MAG: hypothetical protein M0Z99_19645 [Betaproteobacteria bacterium]|nr:hypothetical protein [Betaproteobacteria bacterium]
MSLRFGFALGFLLSALTIIGIFVLPIVAEKVKKKEEPREKRLRGADVLSADDLAKLIRSREQ